MQLEKLNRDAATKRKRMIEADFRQGSNRDEMTRQDRLNKKPADVQKPGEKPPAGTLFSDYPVTRVLESIKVWQVK